jgi:membrane peptidoglycan carboxypeptidase
MKLETAGGEAVLEPEVALALRQALVDTVERGTGRRASGAFHGADGQVLQAGGKTGTGDHRFERFGRGGQLLESTVVNRTATFVFFLGERFFGVISAHVAGPDAAAYGFTSALPTQLLRSLGPQLEPLLQRPPPATEPQLVADPPVPQDVEATLAAPAGDVCEATQRNAWRCTLPTVLQSAVRPGEGLAAQ